MASQRVLQNVRMLFVFTVLIPLAIGAVYSYRQVEASLEQQSHARSFNASSFRGSLILDNLLNAHNVIRMMEAVVSPADSTEGPAEGFATDILVTDAEQTSSAILGTLRAADYPVGELKGLASVGQPSIVVDKETGDIFMSGAKVASERTSTYYFARLRQAGIFGNEHDQLLHAELCVFEGDVLVYCTSGLAAEVDNLRAAMRAADDNNRIRWSSQSGEVYLASARDIFLPSHFNSKIWNVVVAESEDLAFAAISVFRWLFPAMILLLILVALLLVVIQTRRQLGPLSALRQHALRLGDGEFDARLELATNNEFEELADSFNGMADKLGAQFHFLTAMSETDRALLHSANLSSICETILLRVTDILPIESAAVVALDQDPLAEPRLYYMPQGGSYDLEILQGVVPATIVQSMRSSDAVIEVADPQAGLPQLTETFGEAHTVQVHPLHFEDQPLGGLFLGQGSARQWTDDHEEFARGIKDRLTVALSAFERQRRLYAQAHFDHLTGLPNRTLFIDRLEQSLTQAGRQGLKVAVVYADLDRFKSVNDTLGHERGDEVLREAAARFGEHIRESDTVARLSGDEFAFALVGVHDHKDVMRVIHAVATEFAQPFQLHEQEFVLGLSMGVALYPQDGETAEALLQNADLAMYRVKDNPSEIFKFYEERMNVDIRERSVLAQELLHSVRAGELSLAYQPKVDSQTYRIISAEALIRWHHPVHGWISPAKFIPIAEETGLIPEIGEFALRAACQQFAQWREQGLPIQQVAVNVSPRQIQYTDLVSVVKAALDSSGIPASCLELEITEDLLIENYAQTEKVLSELSALGVGLALDDFGTGYSSLSHIHELTFDTLKIDKSFIDKIGESESSDAIIYSIVALGKSLDKKLVVEGVENEKQLAFVAGMGCQLIQGYFFSQPLTADDLTQLLSEGRPLKERTPADQQALL